MYLHIYVTRLKSINLFKEKISYYISIYLECVIIITLTGFPKISTMNRNGIFGKIKNELYTMKFNITCISLAFSLSLSLSLSLYIYIYIYIMNKSEKRK